MLYLLDGYLNRQGVAELNQITPAHIEGFIDSRDRPSPRSYNVLVGAVRGLLDWMVVRDAIPESPLRCKARRVVRTFRPFLFDRDQARRLFEAAGRLPGNPRAQNRGDVYRTIFGLLYGLGLRVGEVSRLRRRDVDLENQLLVVRRTKFGKDRLVPFGPRIGSTIAGFLERQDSRGGPISADCPVFSFDKRKRIPVRVNTISWTFHKLLPALQLVIEPGVAPPHVHCLRHSFAVGTLLRWYRDGIDPTSRLLDLSTFLGHVCPSSTAVYLTITTDLLQCASDRFAHFAEKQPEGERPMKSNPLMLGSVLASFFEDHLKLQRGLRPSSITNYAEAMRLLLQFAATANKKKVTSLNLDDLHVDLVAQFLNSLEANRGNTVQSRNQRLAALRTFFAYVGHRYPERLEQAQKIAAIPKKRTQPPETIFLERDEIDATLAALPTDGRHALRDKVLLVFLYNTGARVQEAADLRARDIRFHPTPSAHLHGKGDKWRVCPLWDETAALLRRLMNESGCGNESERPVFTGAGRSALTRFGIYKIVRRHTAHVMKRRSNGQLRPISPHVWRHSTAVHLLEAGVEVNVIRAWLGHASLETTNRYAEITLRTKQAALETCTLPTDERFPSKPAWQTDASLLNWLRSL